MVLLDMQEGYVMEGYVACLVIVDESIANPHKGHEDHVYLPNNPPLDDWIPQLGIFGDD